MFDVSKSKLLVSALPDSEKNLRTFGVGGAVIFIVIWLVGILLLSAPVRFYLPGLALFFGLTGLYFHGVLRPVYKAWMFIAIRIGHVVTLVLLFSLFILVVTPIGLIRRALGADVLGLKPQKADTYWKDRPSTIAKSSYLKEF